MTSMTNTTVVERDLAIRMFEVMALTRAVEDRMVTMYRQGELLGSLYTGHWHEAIAVGTASALRPTDVLAPLHRDLGAHLCRGLDLNIINPVSHIPNNYPVATGAAFAQKYRGTDGVAMAYCGDGASSRGDFHEALNLAAVQSLPVVFVVENNQYAYSTPLTLTTAATDFASKAVAYGMPGTQVDGIDVFAVHEAAAAAAARARGLFSPHTIPPPRPPPGPGPGTGRRSSRRSPCACTATPSTTRPTTCPPNFTRRGRNATPCRSAPPA
jgi:TPP-dependent pyruvate/acetoin dehydrogenase alpha subunit